MSRAAIRYAKAVLSLASENKAAEAVHADMKLIAAAIADNADLDCHVAKSGDSIIR
jgi:F-type H+-transporting ATPase subunit delta